MNFAFPAGLYFLAAAPLLVALYMLRVRPREQTVPSLLLWQRALQIKSNHHWMGKIRAWLSLLLQLLILLLLVLALSEPRTPAPAGARVLLIDTRGRMQATDALGQSAFIKARRFAETYIESAGESSPIAIVAVGETPQLISAFSGDPKRLREALAQLKPEPGGGDWNDALEFAQSLTAALTTSPEIVALTDRPQGPTGAAFEVLTFGTPAENAGFISAGAREENGTASIFLRAVSHAKAPRETRLEIEQSGQLLDSRVILLPPGDPRDFHFEFPAASEPFTIRLGPADSLAADQSIQLNPPVLPPLRVLLVSAGNWFVEKALRADAGIQFEMLAPEAWNLELSRSFDVTIFDRKIPENFSDNGHFVFLDCAPVAGTGNATNPAVAEFASGDPLLRAVKPDRWMIGEQVVLPSDPSRKEIVTGTHGPLMVTSESENSRWVALLFPLEKSDLPLRASFPVFLQDLLAWASQSSRTPSSVIASLDREGSDLQTAVTSSLPGLPIASWISLSAWRWLAIAAFALLLVEWRTYHRRLTE